jgi:hypothetical protein
LHGVNCTVTAQTNALSGAQNILEEISHIDFFAPSGGDGTAVEGLKALQRGTKVTKPPQYIDLRQSLHVVIRTLVIAPQILVNHRGNRILKSLAGSQLIAVK